MKQPYRFDMSVTREDFLRLLPAAVGGARFVEEGSTFRSQEDARAWQIDFEPLPALALGRVHLDRHRVTFSFEGYVAAEIALFMERFEMYFRRGGG